MPASLGPVCATAKRSFAAVGAGFEQEQAARVGVGQLAGVAHDQFVQLGDVALGRERDADREQAVRFARHRACHIAQPFDLAAFVQEAARGGDRRDDGGGVERSHEPARHVIVLGQPRHRAVAGVGHDDRHGALVAFDHLQSVGDLRARSEGRQPFGLDQVGHTHVRALGDVGERARLVRDAGRVEGMPKRVRQAEILRIDDPECRVVVNAHLR